MFAAAALLHHVAKSNAKKALPSAKEDIVTWRFNLDEKQVGDLVAKFKPFIEWAQRVDLDPKFVPKSIFVENFNTFSPTTGFAILHTTTQCNFESGATRKVEDSIMVRGQATSIFIVFQVVDSENHNNNNDHSNNNNAVVVTEEFTILAAQDRVPVGRRGLLELPSGMVNEAGVFLGKAAQMLKQENFNNALSPDRHVDLTELAFGDEFAGMFPAPSTCDESIRLYLHREIITRKKLQEYQRKYTGVFEHHTEEERIAGKRCLDIALKIVSLDDMWKCAADAKSLSALCIYDQLKLGGMLPATA